jgi:diaminohydroxyphosphoribosylaminopyrimidine deaminase/5-amino-6-(5-phosphoribosylamino)uracil reductase
MVTETDRVFMERALFLAERGRGRTSPNPLVGAVVVSADGVIVGHGAHLEAGGPHAEIFALDEAGARARGGTLYCTLEPCNHIGRTGPCVERILAAGIERVVTAVRDPNQRVRGGGIEALRARGVDVTIGVGADAAKRQNAPFFTWVSKHRPFITLKAAVSKDGFMSKPGTRTRLTGAAADRYFHRQRAEIDAIAVGSGTILADNPQLTARGAYRGRPLTRVVFDGRGRSPGASRVFSTLEHGPVIMVVSASASMHDPIEHIRLEREGVLIDRQVERDLPHVVGWLGARGILTLLVEGGAKLHQAFCDAGLVDSVEIVRTPHVLGTGVALAPTLKQWLDHHAGSSERALGDDTLIEFDVHGTY